ncbi:MULTISPECIES: trypsin-like peptidase domain-containing protein, partial [unclassified Haloferax]|uniref:S1C family serine protease n=1 Tax=unclassified Haloferax TaxID=2625095 RepID=UPI002874C639
MVFIEARFGGYSFGGATGWFVDSEGYIVTNHHVVDGAKELTLWTANGDEYTPTVVGKNKSPDVALLKIEAKKQPTLTIGSSDGLEVDQPMVSVGHPSSVGNWIIGLGQFTGAINYEEAPDDLGSTLPGTQGSSGSPVFSMNGEVVGLTYGGMPKNARMPGETPEVTDDKVYEKLDPTLFCRRLLIQFSCCSEIEEGKDTALAVSDTNDSAGCVWLGIAR